MTATTKTQMFRMHRVPFTRKKPLKVSATRQTVADGNGIDFHGGFVCGHYRFPQETAGCVRPFERFGDLGFVPFQDS